ncbi:MAG: dihydrofolate reductase, partial [Rhodothermales bacterium]|nr:dihydrofolate reductase [Rhodothermales bacterium]
MQLPITSVFIAMSLDGFIARSDGDVSWLPTSGAPEDGDFGYGSFMSGIDTIVYGRKTFEKVMTMDFWPFREERVIVLSTGTPHIPEQRKDQVETLNLEPGDLLDRLGREGAQGVYVDGGITIQRFLRAGALDMII